MSDEVWKQACSPWRPIETAPKDGTRILVYRPGKHWYPTIGTDYWQIDHRRGCWWKSPTNGQPTHWMPLPEPPHDQAPEGRRATS